MSEFHVAIGTNLEHAFVGIMPPIDDASAQEIRDTINHMWDPPVTVVEARIQQTASGEDCTILDFTKDTLPPQSSLTEGTLRGVAMFIRNYLERQEHTVVVDLIPKVISDERQLFEADTQS